MALVVGGHVFVFMTHVANCPVSAAGPELCSPIATLDLHFSEPIGLDRSGVPELRKIIAGPPSECSRRKLSWSERCTSATNHATLGKLRYLAHRHARWPRKRAIAARA